MLSSQGTCVSSCSAQFISDYLFANLFLSLSIWCSSVSNYIFLFPFMKTWIALKLSSLLHFPSIFHFFYLPSFLFHYLSPRLSSHPSSTRNWMKLHWSLNSWGEVGKYLPLPVPLKYFPFFTSQRESHHKTLCFLLFPSLTLSTLMAINSSHSSFLFFFWQNLFGPSPFQDPWDQNLFWLHSCSIVRKLKTLHLIFVLFLCLFFLFSLKFTHYRWGWEWEWGDS